ncbi:hypothetical protein [Streptomyces sp. 3211]|uniref:hypothetical protein n=1 Tax=Streptomyces sp. 3211 TaxID=1964449 RepID=UPI0009A53746|nr:hypothetical protein [Streptomyces sp. 3211]
MTSQFHTERLREVFAEAAYEIAPSPVPLAAIERTARAHRRRRTAVLTTVCGLLLVPLAVTAVQSGTLSSAGPAALPAAPAAPQTARVVAPGERVEAAPQVQLWLTKDGKHWSTPEKAGQFRSVTDGNLDMSQPGASLQAEPAQGRYFLSGIYHGKGDAATVEIETAKGTVIGTVVRLAAETGWGAWYATSPLPDQTMVKDRRKQGFVRSVTVHDTAGQIIAQVTLPGFS